MIAPELREVALSSVDLREHPFKIPEAEESPILRESLTEVGMLAPPRLKARPGGRFQVVTGWKRLKAAQQLGWPQVRAVILKEDLPEIHELLLYLHDNAFCRPFNPLEQALLARRFLSHWPRERVLRQVLPLLRLPPSPAHLARLLAVAHLEPPWQDLVAQSRLALGAGSRLAAWALADREAAWPYFSGLPLTQCQQEEMLEAVEILARREGGSPGAVLSREELRLILEGPGLPGRERVERLRHILRKWLHPRLTEAAAEFAAILRELNLKNHPHLRLHAPPGFEGPDFKLEIKFQSRQELQGHLEELGRLAENPRFADLFSL